MIRKLILPAIATLLLAGCATGYTYRSASGDYYYGQPSTVYRDYYGGYGYYGGYPYYGYSPYRWGGSIRYSWGYPYGYGYYRSPWRGHGHGHGRPHNPRPGNDNDGGSREPDRATPPWRDLDRIRNDRGRPDVPRSNELRVRPVQPIRPGQQSRPVQQSRPSSSQARPARVQRPAPRVRAELRRSPKREVVRPDDLN